ncbi:hypothetical protein [Alistipes sp.]|uniref:hypothetical protein n=1 Tax=Alistipes sp. TaxID=1872444 RepID=UPI0025C696F9|nr:hypothetical protein [Alistipes sp.]
MEPVDRPSLRPVVGMDIVHGGLAACVDRQVLQSAACGVVGSLRRTGGNRRVGHNQRAAGLGDFAHLFYDVIAKKTRRQNIYFRLRIFTYQRFLINQGSIFAILNLEHYFRYPS